MKKFAALVLFLVSVVVLPSRGAAQIRPGDAGFQMRVGTVTTGTLCRGFQCSPYQAGARRASKVELFVRGVKNQPFLVLFSVSARNCVAIPGLFHSLVVSLPVPLVVGGVMSTQDRIRACPGGIGLLQFTIPGTLPPKSQFAMQAIATSFPSKGMVLAFTPAIVVTIN